MLRIKAIFFIVALIGLAGFSYVKDTSYPIDVTGINVDYYNGVQYGSFNNEELDILVPTDAVSPTPLVIYYHGGGYTSGTLDAGYSDESLVQGILSDTIAFATIGYRLRNSDFSPGITTFDCIDSGIKGFNFLLENKELFNIDPNKVFIIGGSAGTGHALYLALSQTSSTPYTIKGISLNKPQSSLNLYEWERIFPDSIGYSARLEYNTITASKRGYNATYGVSNYDDVLEPRLYNKVKSYDTYVFLEKGKGVPTFIGNTGELYTTLVGNTLTDLVHSPFHALYLRDKLVENGYEVQARISGIDTTLVDTQLQFILDKLD